MKAVIFLTLSLLASSAFACLPSPGTITQEVVIRGQVVGLFHNTVGTNRQGSAIEVVLKRKAGRLTLNVESDQAGRNTALTRINSDRARIEGRWLAGGERMTVIVNNESAVFDMPRMKCM